MAESAFETKRLKLQNQLESILGSSNVMFEPTDHTMFTYPVIVYNRTTPNINYADNLAYLYKDSFEATFISKSGITDIPRRLVTEIPMCSEDRSFVTDGLHHYVVKIFI